MNENKQHLQVLSIQLETLAELESVKKFLELQQKAQMLSQLIKKEEESNEQVWANTNRTWSNGSP